MPAPVVQQVISSMKIIMGLDNTNSGTLFATVFLSALFLSYVQFPQF